MKTKITSFVTACLLLFASSVIADDERPEVGPYVYGYTGDFGSYVYVVRLGAKENNEALVYIHGIDHELDRQIVKASILQRNENVRSFTIGEGEQSREIMRLEGSGGTLFVSSAPVGLSRYSLYYDSKVSASMDAQHLLTQWLNQQ